MYLLTWVGVLRILVLIMRRLESSVLFIYKNGTRFHFAYQDDKMTSYNIANTTSGRMTHLSTNIGVAQWSLKPIRIDESTRSRFLVEIEIKHTHFSS